ncbi:AraC family transcriptional regulator [Flavivirga spongiicola]|uniref:AraC family transcriptional regulator n=1 Tax=Flavivirga spongiicola TaxID=421621 RepID=A0ABU7XVS3_9FLAO|nr:helix-turn-helix domain-containing protein [Flavivirga sp. MEBiC05379]MDO5979867.1 helix-turn-helix domain-containing protein [Flavivirga sp. MEBiC05379]
MEVLFFIGIVICFFLALLIFSKKKQTKSDRIFGVWQILLVINFSLLYIRHSELIQEYPHFIGLDTGFTLLHIPFIFFYTCALIKKPLKKIHFSLHLLPFVVMTMTLFSTFFLLSGNEKLQLYNQQLSGQKLFSVTDMALYLQCLIYLPISYNLVKKHSRKIKAKYSNIDKRNLSWMETILISVSIYFGLSFLFHLYYILSDFNDFQFLSKISILSFCLLQVALAFFGIRYSPVFIESEMSKLNEQSKYKKTGLGSDLAKKHFEALLHYMTNEKPYLDSELTLDNLASQINISSNHLSQIINQFAHKNFYTYVNEYRIDEIARLLKDPSQNQYSILGLAYDAGFKSKSVFNAMFKKIKGVTPSEFRKRI